MEKELKKLKRSFTAIAEVGSSKGATQKEVALRVFHNLEQGSANTAFDRLKTAINDDVGKQVFAEGGGLTSFGNEILPHVQDAVRLIANLERLVDDMQQIANGKTRTRNVVIGLAMPLAGTYADLVRELDYILVEQQKNAPNHLWPETIEYVEGDLTSLTEDKNVSIIVFDSRTTVTEHQGRGALPFYQRRLESYAVSIFQPGGNNLAREVGIEDLADRPIYMPGRENPISDSLDSLFRTQYQDLHIRIKGYVSDRSVRVELASAVGGYYIDLNTVDRQADPWEQVGEVGIEIQRGIRLKKGKNHQNWLPFVECVVEWFGKRDERSLELF